MQILRYAAFTDRADGGNPAGVVLEAAGLDDDDMLRIAAEVGYSETAFLFSDSRVRYFSPKAEVPFCGHATIALAAAHAQRHGAGELVLTTKAGVVPVSTTVEGEVATATLTSVEPKVELITAGELAELLAALDWTAGDLDPALPPRVAYAGAWHPVIAAGSRDRLARLNYDFDQLAALMHRRDWTTISLVWRESAGVFHARNPFPPGGVIEDPATGAAAAALGGYLRTLQLVAPPTTVSIHQGDDIGRPSLITVGIGPADGIKVTGQAVVLPIRSGS